MIDGVFISYDLRAIFTFISKSFNTLNFKMFQKCHYRHVIDEKYKHSKQNSSSQCHFVYMEPMT